MKRYPYWKVGLGFLLCPGIGGIISAAVGSYYQVIDPEISWLAAVGFFIATSPVFIFFSVIVNIPPAFVLSIVLLFFRPYYSFLKLIFIALLGGVLSFFWGEYLSPGNEGVGYWKAVSKNWLTLPFISAFLLGAISSFLMALWILPKRSEESYGVK
ncbi:hypothetical protein [Alcaligenes faecalis]|uniref:hypothetical protein n=1 Tax=Alcaligenes faecalis TaxID=511 RepID=UPI0013DDC7CB|nr:hypothetical protein [Alcaligenes faecalis]